MTDPTATVAALPHFYAPAPRVEHRADRSILVWQDIAPDAAPRSVAHLFVARAREIGERTLVAERGRGDDWLTCSYAEALDRSVRVATALRARGLLRGDRVMILSGEGIAHLVLTLGAVMAGLTVVPVSTGYSLTADHARLRHVIELTAPALAFADDAVRYAAALATAAEAGVATIAGCDALDDLEREAHVVAADVFLDDIASDLPWKILFTSGSTALPKAVVHTHAMACASLASERALSTHPRGVRRPTALLEWMPWSHVGGAVTIFTNAIDAGATLYLDDGRPVPGRFAATLRNLRDIEVETFTCPPSAMAMLNEAFDNDPDLRARFFERLGYVKSGAAVLSHDVHARFQRHSIAAVGHATAVLSGYGATETLGAISTTQHSADAAVLGYPKPGVIAKLVPAGKAMELRIRSPAVTPGYFRDAQATAAAFDEEGFFRTGDSVSIDASGAIVYRGRLSENFKLATGTWVAAGELRATMAALLPSCVIECLVFGEGERLPALMVWTSADLTARTAVLDALREYNVAERATSRRIGRVVFSETPISNAAFERTEKGSLNRALILAHRHAECKGVIAIDDAITG